MHLLQARCVRPPWHKYMYSREKGADLKNNPDKSKMELSNMIKTLNNKKFLAVSKWYKCANENLTFYFMHYLYIF